MGKCQMVSDGERIQEVKGWLSKHGDMEGEIIEKVAKGSHVIGALAVVMNGSNVPREIRRG